MVLGMSFAGMGIESFVGALASKDPVPGGGAAAALMGAIGTALGNMVGGLTAGKAKYADVQADIAELMAKADLLQSSFLSLMARDAEAFEPLALAYGMPRGTEEERALKARVMEAALVKACAVPLEIMRACCDAIDVIEAFAAKGAAIAISDAGCGAACCKAALLCAALNVFINTKSMADRPHAESCNLSARRMLETHAAKAQAVFDEVAAKLAKA